MPINKKAKGLNAERELVKMFWDNGWAAVRVAASGAIKWPAPDVLAGNSLRKFAIEVKITKTTKQYFTKKEVDELKEFAKLFGTEVWLAIKFNRLNWYFVSPEDIDKTDENYVIDIRKAKIKGLTFNELINKNYYL